MMREVDIYRLTPLGSLITRSVAEEEVYLQELDSLPKPLRAFISSLQVAAFLRGTLRVQNLPDTLGPDLAFIVLQIVYGKLPLNQMASKLTTDYQIPVTQAQNIAQEIERELFTPIALEFNSYLNQSKKFGQPKPATPAITKPAVAAQGVRNVVDLKQQRPAVPTAPPIPPTISRPVAKPYPPRPDQTTSIHPGAVPLPPRPVVPPSAFPHPNSAKPKPGMPFDPESLKRKSQLWQAKK